MYGRRAPRAERDSLSSDMSSTISDRPDPCWICGARGASPWAVRNLGRDLEPDDLRITDHRYGVTLALRECRECSFIFAEAGELSKLTALYQSLHDPAYGESFEPRLLQMRWLLDAALRLRPDASSMLDIGAAAGLMVAEARARGLDAVGVEPSERLIEAGRREYGVDLLEGVLPHPELEGRRFDLVFAIDLIEHVADPVDLLRQAAEHLDRDGVLALVTPDVGSLAARLFGRRWWHRRLAHVGYFNKRSLGLALEKAGLVTVRRSRAKWFFTLDYLAIRLQQYLPIGAVNRALRRSRSGRWLLGRITPLNLYDSFLYFARRADGGDPGGSG